MIGATIKLSLMPAHMAIERANKVIANANEAVARLIGEHHVPEKHALEMAMVRWPNIPETPDPERRRARYRAGRSAQGF